MITPGKQNCGACVNGFIGPFAICRACDGTSVVWQEGGPRFGAPMCLAERSPGEVVELATGERCRILWHVPRKRRGQRPFVAFVAMIDAFDDHENDTPIPCDATLGVRSVAARTGAAVELAVELHDGEKDADLVDPFARRQREDGEDLF